MGYAVLLCFLGLLAIALAGISMDSLMKAGRYWEVKRIRGFLYDYEKEECKNQLSLGGICFAGVILCSFFIMLPMM